jgi:hypothetical protein
MLFSTGKRRRRRRRRRKNKGGGEGGPSGRLQLKYYR